MGKTKNKQLIILILLFACTFLIVHGFSFSRKSGKRIALAQYFEKIEGYTTQRDSPLSDEVFQALDLDDYLSTAYSNANGRVSLYIGYYYSIDKVSAAHSPTVCLPSQGWVISQPVIKTVTVGNEIIHYAEIVASILESKALVLYWYQAGNLTTPYIYKNKINTLLNKLSEKTENHAFVRISVPFSPERKEEAENLAIDFIKAFYPQFVKFVNDGPTYKEQRSSVKNKEE